MVKEETRPIIAGLTLSCLLNKKYLILFTSSKYSTILHISTRICITYVLLARQLPCFHAVCLVNKLKNELKKLKNQLIDGESSTRKIEIQLILNLRTIPRNYIHSINWIVKKKKQKRLMIKG